MKLPWEGPFRMWTDGDLWRVCDSYHQSVCTCRTKAHAQAITDLLNHQAEVGAEVEHLRAENLDLKQEMFLALACLIKEGHLAGWWDSMALSSACTVGDDLVEAGRFERHPDGYGRRWFYRPKADAAAEAAKGGKP